MVNGVILNLKFKMMSVKQLWLNLPVKDIAGSKQFFTEIGFRENPIHKGSTNLAGFLIGDQDFVLMLFEENDFKSFTNHEISDTKSGSEMLINIDAQSKEEVDVMEALVRKAGGEVYQSAAESQSWLYGFGFKDPDGHRWAVLYMDMGKMPRG